MPNRKKRNKKALISLKKTLKKHIKKRKDACEAGQIELGDYYDKEIKEMERQLKKRESYISN